MTTARLPEISRRSETTLRAATPYADLPPQTIDALPAVVNLLLYQGDDLLLLIEGIVDRNGDPADLTGATPASQIKATPYADVMAEFAPTASGDTLLLHLPHTEATALEPGSAMWDCQVTEAGEVSTLCYGSVTVTAEITT